MQTATDIPLIMIASLLALIAAPGIAALSFLVWGI